MILSAVQDSTYRYHLPYLLQIAAIPPSRALIVTGGASLLGLCGRLRIVVNPGPLRDRSLSRSLSDPEKIIS